MNDGLGHSWIAMVAAISCLATATAYARSTSEIRAQAIAQEPAVRDIAAPTPDKTRYALWELVSLGLDTSTADAMLDMLRGEMQKVVGDRLVVSARAVEEDTRKAVDECDDKIACLAEATGAFGAQRAVFGVVTNLGDTYSMSLKLLDVKRREVIARESATLTGDRNQLLQQIEILLFRLIAPSRLLGNLTLNIDATGADVYVDGEKVGTTPLTQKLKPLSEGEHSLKVTAPRIEDYFTFFKVFYGKTTEVTVDATQLQQVQASLAATHRPLKPVILGVKIGYGSNFGKLSSPAVAIEAGGCIWALSEYLFVGAEASYLQHQTTARSVQGERVTTGIWSVPVVGWVGIEAPLSSGAVYGRAGAGAALVNRSVKSSDSGRTASRGAEPTFYGAGGGRLKLGPGAFIIEVSYTHTMADSVVAPGSAGGLKGLTGYGLEI
jgi:hypothetical protein